MNVTITKLTTMPKSRMLTISLPDEEEEKPEEKEGQLVCPYCGYTCPYSELGGEFDCPWCGDN